VISYPPIVVPIIRIIVDEAACYDSGMSERVRRLLAGEDSPTRTGLPLNELLAPLPLCALALLGVNDWVLKGSGAPAWLTGKLSDFAGIFVFPLVATALCDLVLYAAWRVRAPVDFTLRRWKLALAIALEVAGFATLKLWPAGSDALVRAMRVVLPSTHVAMDATDLLAFVTLPVTWWHGRRVLARGAYGRLAWAARAGEPAPFADAVACGADAAVVAALHAATTDAARATALAQLRGCHSSISVPSGSST
jgi:hypothetical protein